MAGVLLQSLFSRPMTRDRLNDLERLGNLLDQGRITQTEYERLKAETLEAEPKRRYKTSNIIVSLSLLTLSRPSHSMRRLRMW